MKLVIDRSKWARGCGEFKSTDLLGNRLLDEQGKMCCLGFFGLACGINEDKLLGAGNPSDEADPQWPAWLVSAEVKRDPEDDYEYTSIGTTDECWALMRDNDDAQLTESEREARVAAGFAKRDVEVEFVDGTPSGEG